MPALPQYYVDPASGSDSTGTGAVGTPWQTLQHALDTVTPGTYGDQINLKAGTSNVLTGDLDFSTYNPGSSTSSTKKLVIRGYTSAENDGGRGTIDGDASYVINQLNTTCLIDLEITNTDPARDGCLGLANYSQMINLYVHTIDSSFLYNTAQRTQMIDCRFENISGQTIRAGLTGYARNLYFQNGPDYSFTTAFRLSAQGALHNSIFNISGSSDGIDCSSINATVTNCTFFGNGGTGTAFKMGGTDGHTSMFANNIVQGFSGTGGVGCENNSDYGIVFRNNTFFDNATDFTDPSTAGDAGYRDKTGNESVGSSPLALTGSANYANRFAYFAPQNVGNVLSGDFARGAVPALASSSPSPTKHPLGRF